MSSRRVGSAPQDRAEREQRGHDEQRGPDHAGDPVRLADDDEDGFGRREDERSQERPNEGRSVGARIEADLVTWLGDGRHAARFSAAWSAPPNGAAGASLAKEASERREGSTKGTNSRRERRILPPAAFQRRRG